MKQYTIPPRDYLAGTAVRWPGLWAACERIRAKFSQPPECYLTDHFGGAALLDSVRNSGNEADMQMLREWTAVEAGREVAAATTTACWRMTQGIYRIDPTLYDTLIHTPLTGDLPVDVLLRLPEWCIYIETPGLQMDRLGGGAPVELRGCFARIDANGVSTIPGTPAHAPGESGPYSLAIGLDMPEAAGRLECQHVPLAGTIDDALSEALGAWGVTDTDVRARVRGHIDPIINLLLYICAVGEISGKHGQPANPQPTRTRRDGVRLFAADGTRTWDVGVRMGAALRAAYHALETGAGGTHAGPRGHVRRAHWHGFRSGPMKRPDGSEIPASDRQFNLRWLPPIAVNLPDLDNLPATIHRVRNP